MAAVLGYFLDYFARNRSRRFLAAVQREWVVVGGWRLLRNCVTRPRSCNIVTPLDKYVT